MEKIVEVVVEGGKATAAPPLGPALGPLGVNIMKIVSEINEKTKDLAGMKVPVKVIVETGKKNYRIEVGKPPASALILKEVRMDKGSALPGKDRVGDLSMEQVKRISRAKFGSDEKPYVNQIMGTCRSMGVTIEKGSVSAEELKAAQEHKEHIKDDVKKVAAAPAEAGAEPAAEAAAPAAGEKKKAGK
jgi:large subunit ribosomal protein L11